MLKPKIFRGQDICGIADSELHDDDVEILGKALATYLIRYSGRVICLGRDARASSSRLHAALLRGLKSAGARVLDIQTVPTPVLYYSVFHFTADAGIMITGGSESPAHNGFKIVCGTSLLLGHALEDIYKVIQIADFEVEEGNVKPADALTPYTEEILSQFQLARSLKLHLNADSETVLPLLKQLLKRLNVAVVKKGEAMAGVSVSPDADRIDVSDEKGNPVSPEMLLLLFGREILKRKPNSALLYDRQFPEAISRKLTELGGNMIPVNPSESPIQARIKQERAELSVLASGEIVFADRYYGFSDAIYAACRLLEIMAATEEPLSEAVAQLSEIVAPAPNS